MSDKERQDEDTKILKEWYRKQPHLPQEIEDEYFLTFASGCKSIEIAKQKIDAFFSMRHDLLWFKDFDNLMDRFLKEEGGDFFLLPQTTTEGWRVLFASYIGVDMSKLDPVLELFRRMMSVELALITWPRDTSVALVFDVKGATAGYFARFDLPAELSVLNFSTRAFPKRLKKILVLNSTPIVEKITNVFRPLMSKKLNDRVVLMQGADKLKEIITPSILPKEYGGEAGTTKELGDSWRQTMLEANSWYREKMKLRSDESKRPKESAETQLLDFGHQGTFRTLSID